MLGFTVGENMGHLSSWFQLSYSVCFFFCFIHLLVNFMTSCLQTNASPLLCLLLWHQREILETRNFKRSLFRAMCLHVVLTRGGMLELALTLNLTQSGVIWKPPLSKQLDHINLWSYLRGTVLITTVRGSIPLWTAPFPGQVVLGCFKKLAANKSVSKPANSVLPLSLPQTLAWGLSLDAGL